MGKDFTPPVKGGFESDDAYHRRNLRALVEYLRTPFVGTSRIEDGAITSIKIGSAAITDAQIESLSVDKLTGGDLSAEVIVTGSLRTGDPPAQRVEIDNDGIRAFDSVNEQTVRIPVTGDPYFKGVIIAAGLEVEGSAVYRSIGNLIGNDAEMRIAGSTVGEPSTAPAVVFDWPSLGLTGEWDSDPATFYNAGYFDSVSDRYYLATENMIRWYNATTGAFIGSYDVSAAMGTPAKVIDLTKGGTYWWALVRVDANGDFYLVRWNDGEFNGADFNISVPFSTGPNYQGLTWEASSQRLIVGQYINIVGSGADTFRVYWVTEARVIDRSASVNVVSSRIPETLHHTGTRLYGLAGVQTIQYVPPDIVQSNILTAYTLNYAGSSIVATAGDDVIAWATGVACIFGAKGTGFLAVSMLGSPLIREFTTWNDAVSQLNCRYTWFNTGDSGETRGSPSASVAYKAHARLSVSVGAAIPTGLDRFRVYLDQQSPAGVAPPQTSPEYKLQGTFSSSPQSFTSFTAGAAIPTLNTTGGVGAGRFASDDGGFEINGDGTGAWPHVMPPGTILLYGGASVPPAFLACDGTDVSRTTYAALFTAIGTIYGVGDGSSTFGLPAEADLTSSGLAQWIIKT